MNSIVKDTLSITVITLVAGLALGIHDHEFGRIRWRYSVRHGRAE